MKARKSLIKNKDEEQTQMSEKNIKICLENQEAYFTPQLNDVLELHFYRFNKIQNLNPFYNINTLYLQNNAVGKIENLQNLNKLVTLNLSNNRITTIEGLNQLTQLSLLYLSGNKITHITGLNNNKKLTMLDISHNLMQVPESVKELENNKNLTCLNLTANPLDNNPQLFLHLSQIQSLITLYLKQTKFSRGIHNYRKQTIFNIKALTFLDDRPVTQAERKLVEAWKQGGIVRQNQVRKQIQKSKQDKNAKIYQEIKERSQKFEKLRNQLFQNLTIPERRELQNLKHILSHPTEQIDIKLLNNKIEEIQGYLCGVRQDVKSMSVEKMPEVPTNLCQKHEADAIYIYGVQQNQLAKIKQKYYPDQSRPLIAVPLKKDDEVMWINRYDDVLEQVHDEYGSENPEYLLTKFNLKVHEIDSSLNRKAHRFTLEQVINKLKDKQGGENDDMNELD